MSSGNLGNIPFRRSGGSRRRRIVLSIASIVALVALIVLAGTFFRAPHVTPVEIWILVALLVLGIVWRLRPWAK